MWCCDVVMLSCAQMWQYAGTLVWCCGNKVVLQPPSVVYPPLSDNRDPQTTRCKITWGDELLSREWLLWMINCTYVSPLAQSLFITSLLSVVYTLSLSVDLELVKHIFSWEPALWTLMSRGADAADDDVKKKCLKVRQKLGTRKI